MGVFSLYLALVHDGKQHSGSVVKGSGATVPRQFPWLCNARKRDILFLIRMV